MNIRVSLYPEHLDTRNFVCSSHLDLVKSSEQLEKHKKKTTKMYIKTLFLGWFLPPTYLFLQCISNENCCYINNNYINSAILFRNGSRTFSTNEWSLLSSFFVFTNHFYSLYLQLKQCFTMVNVVIFK